MYIALQNKGIRYITIFEKGHIIFRKEKKWPNSPFFR